MQRTTKKTVLVVGGGHAGVEAALAAERVGCNVVLVTMNKHTVGRMSCNPSIGGLAKGQMVREVDALGGIMGLAADKTGTQFKILNKSKGRAVWSPRAQVDKMMYEKYIQTKIGSQKNIQLLEAEVVSPIIKQDRCVGVALSNNESISCSAVVLTNGTFLNGVLHIGDKKIPAGRMGETRSQGVTESLSNYGLKHGRLKTGTPPRLNGNSINWDRMVSLRGDKNPSPFSHYHSSFNPPNAPSYSVNTNKNVHNIILENLDKSPMISGDINGIGPRYCPSVEDKVHRFKNRDSHRLICEPEWGGADQIYLNGFSTSMPEDIQRKALQQIEGLQNVSLIKPGYAIEYDYFFPNQLKSTLETKSFSSLFLAGQINGTSGYEEAAAQGLMAGINAVRSLNKKDPIILRRDQAYIGVLIDDLILKVPDEPYRMFTSRAEYRLTLRADNADQRLTEIGINVNLVKEIRKKMFLEKRKNILALTSSLKNNYLTPNEAKKYDIKIAMDGVKRTCLEIIGQRNVSMAKIRQVFPNIPSHKSAVENQVAIDAHYMGYLDRQTQDIKSFKKDESLSIPSNINYESLNGLSNEIKSKLTEVRPKTLGQAIRIDGVTPAAIIILLSYIKRMKYKVSA